MYITKVIQRPKWSLISAKYCDIMWALLLLEIKINFIFCDSRNVTTLPTEKVMAHPNGTMKVGVGLNYNNI